MLFDHNNRDRFPWDKQRKLKYLAFPSVYYRLLNTSYVFRYNSILYCRYDEFQGCRTKPINGMITNQNYCYACRVKVTYDEKKIINLRKIAFVHYNFIEIKKGIQLCIDYDPSCKDFWMYHDRRTVKRGFKMTIYFQWEYLPSWINKYIYQNCKNDQ